MGVPCRPCRPCWPRSRADGCPMPSLAGFPMPAMMGIPLSSPEIGLSVILREAKRSRRISRSGLSMRFCDCAQNDRSFDGCPMPPMLAPVPCRWVSHAVPTTSD